MTIEYYNYDSNDNSNQQKFLRKIKSLIQQNISVKGTKYSSLRIWLVGDDQIFYRSVITVQQHSNENKEIQLTSGEINYLKQSDFKSIIKNKDMLQRFFINNAKQNMIRISFSVCNNELQITIN
ncbi:MAG TPA: hypothetical protein PK993_01100 [Clostridia bacterium]|nr:hypothetical protein [Clostridia bacterium]